MAVSVDNYDITTKPRSDQAGNCPVDDILELQYLSYDTRESMSHFGGLEPAVTLFANKTQSCVVPTHCILTATLFTDTKQMTD